MDELIVGTTGRTALGRSLVKPEPHDGGVVFLACGEITSWFSSFLIHRLMKTSDCTSLTEAAHHPLLSNARHDMRVLLGPCILLGLQNTVGILESVCHV